MEKVEILFVKDFAPREKGDKVKLDKKLAEHYLSIGVAIAPNAKTKEDCGCAKKSLKLAETLKAENETLKAENLALKEKLAKPKSTTKTKQTKK